MNRALIIEGDPNTREIVNNIATKYEMDFWSMGNVFSRDLNINIRDPILGNIKISSPESYLMTTSLVVRTNNIKQLSSTRYINSGATHTRLSHQLGVFFISKRIWSLILSSSHFKETLRELLIKRLDTHWLSTCKTIVDNCNYNEIYDKYSFQIHDFLEEIGSKIIGIAALLHDIGHGGWGHILDSLNGIIFNMINESLQYSGNYSTLSISPGLVEVQKLDITAASYIISNNEQIVRAINEGFIDYIRKLNDTEFYNVFLKMIQINSIPTIITTIISEDMTITVKQGLLWSIALRWFSRLSNDLIKNKNHFYIFTIITELLTIIAMIGIQIIGDIKYGSKTAGFNSDRLDWIRRDSHHLGICTDNETELKVCQKLKNLDELINLILDKNNIRDVEIFRFNIDDKRLLIYIYPGSQLENLHHTVKEVRKYMYDIYHHNLKGIYDSILIRTGYAAISILWHTLAYNMNYSIATETAIAHILNNDELFISYTSDLLRSVRTARASTGLVLDKLLNNLGDVSPIDLNKLDQLCSYNCKYAINSLYILSSSDEELIFLLDQPYTLMHLKIYKGDIYYPVLIKRPGRSPSKVIITEEIKLKDIPQLNSILRLVSTDLQIYKDNIINSIKAISSSIESAKLPLLEYIINKTDYKEEFRLDHIYVNYIHYGLNDYINAIRTNETEKDTQKEKILSRPLLYIFYSQSIEKDSQPDSERIINNIIKMKDDMRKILSSWFKYVIIKNIASPDLRKILEKELR